MALDAPFQTGSELINAPGNAALSGVAQNFDPENKNPLAPLQNTFNQLDQESNQALEQKRAQAFQQLQQQREFQNDILKRHMDYDHQDAVVNAANKYKENQEKYDYYTQTGNTSYTATGPDGKPVNLPFLKAHQDEVNAEADAQRKKITSDPNYWHSNAMAQDYKDITQKQVYASMAAQNAAEVRRLMSQTYDPDEKKRQQDYLDYIEKFPLTDAPHPFVSMPTVRPQIDVANEYKDGKGFESFDAGLGVPNSRYIGLGQTTDPAQINDGFKKYNFFKTQHQDADTYNQTQDQLNTITDSRKLPRIDLGGRPDKDGNIVYDDNTYKKGVQLAKKHLVAAELLNNGALMADPDADKDAADLKGKQLSNKIQEMIIANGGVKPKSQSPEDILNYTNSVNTVKTAKELFNPDKYENGGIALVQQKVAPVYERKWGIGPRILKNPDEKGEYNKVDGINVAGTLQMEGYNPSEWKVFKAPSGIEDGVGVERVGEGLDAKGKPNGKINKTGNAEKVDSKFMIYNPDTKEVKAMYFQKRPEDGTYKLLSIVDGRQYVSNVPLPKHKFKEEASEDVTRNQNLWDQGSSKPAVTTSTSRPASIPLTAKVVNIGGKTYYRDGENAYDGNGNLIPKRR